jgi:hypothetical protein
MTRPTLLLSAEPQKGFALPIGTFPPPPRKGGCPQHPQGLGTLTRSRGLFYCLVHKLWVLRGNWRARRLGFYSYRLAWAINRLGATLNLLNGLRFVPAKPHELGSEFVDAEPLHSPIKSGIRGRCPLVSFIPSEAHHAFTEA